MGDLVLIFFLLIKLWPFLCLGLVFKIMQYHYTDGETWRRALGIAFEKFIAPSLGILLLVSGVLLSVGILYFFYTIFENAFF